VNSFGWPFLDPLHRGNVTEALSAASEVQFVGLAEALELFVDRQMAELMVDNWDRDEPDRAGELYVEPVELQTSVN
jgi:hypothetical protein